MGNGMPKRSVIGFANDLQLSNDGTTGALSVGSVIAENDRLIFNHSNTFTHGTEFGSAAIGMFVRSLYRGYRQLVSWPLVNMPGERGLTFRGNSSETNAESDLLAKT